MRLLYEVGGDDADGIKPGLDPVGGADVEHLDKRTAHYPHARLQAGVELSLLKDSHPDRPRSPLHGT